jgi:hypothetical protein
MNFVINLLDEGDSMRSNSVDSLYDYQYYGGVKMGANGTTTHNDGNYEGRIAEALFNGDFQYRALKHNSEHKDRLELDIPLRKIFNFFRDVRADKLTKNVVWELELELNPAEQIICDNTASTEPHDLRWVSEGAQLLVPVYTPSLEWIKELESQLLGDGINQRFTFFNSKIYRNPITTGDAQINITNIISKPHRVMVWFAQQANFLDSKLNQFIKSGLYPNADNGGLQTLSVFVNGLEIPYNRFNFGDTTATGGANEREVKRAYVEFVESQGLFNSEARGGSVVSYEDWKRNYPIFMFDVEQTTAVDNVYRGGNELIVKYTSTDGFKDDPKYMYVMVIYRNLVEMRMDQYSSSVLVQ